MKSAVDTLIDDCAAEIQRLQDALAGLYNVKKLLTTPWPLVDDSIKPPRRKAARSPGRADLPVRPVRAEKPKRKYTRRQTAAPAKGGGHNAC